MTDQRPTPPSPAADEAAALRQTGASPLRINDPGRVGPYVPLALLGSGGMGRVYLSRAADDGPGLFAVKVIRPEYAEDVRFQRRFQREAAVHTRLGPPYAPRLCGTGFEDELLWMATEYVPGLDLTEAVRGSGALPAATVWRLAAELGRALTALTTAGVVHRDLKPSNVLLSPEGVHLIDFGISKAADASALTGTGNRVGTPAYMSPEYLRTGRCGPASDVFSLAGTLVYAVTGQAPFGDGTGVDVMHRVAFEEPYPEVTAAVSEADPELAALLSRCLAKEPGGRPTPGELSEIAGAHAGASDWPEPLHGEVLARRQAYETLHRIPVERAARLRPTDYRAPAARAPLPASPPAPPSGPASGPAPSGADAGQPEPAVAVAAAVSTDVTSGALSAKGSESRERGRRVPAVGAVLALCAVAAGVFVLVRPEGPSTAAPAPDVATATGGERGASPGNAALPKASGVADGASAEGSPGERTDVTDADGSDDTAVRPEASGSADGGGHSTPAADPSTADTTPSAESSTTPTTASAEPADRPWNTECTYYYGSGRTLQGDSGKKVLQVQCMLTKRGYDLGSDGVNGVFGADTESAVISFKSAKGLAANGVVNSRTWVALRADD